MWLNLFYVCWSGTGGVGPDCVRECCVLTGGEPPARPSVNINTHCGRLITSPWRENIAGTWNQFYPLENAHSDWQWPHCALTGTEYNKQTPLCLHPTLRHIRLACHRNLRPPLSVGFDSPDSPISHVTRQKHFRQTPCVSMPG